MFAVAGSDTVFQAVAADRAGRYFYSIFLFDRFCDLDIGPPGDLLPCFNFGEYKFGHDAGEVVVCDFGGPAVLVEAGTESAPAVAALDVSGFAVAVNEVGRHPDPVLCGDSISDFGVSHGGPAFRTTFGTDGGYIFAHDHVQLAVSDLPRPAFPFFGLSFGVLISGQWGNLPNLSLCRITGWSLLCVFDNIGAGIVLRLRGIVCWRSENSRNSCIAFFFK